MAGDLSSNAVFSGSSGWGSATRPLGEWWRDLVQMRTLQIVTPSPISPQTTRSHLLRYPLRTFPAGQYRACFRYRLGGKEDGRETCSAPFAHSIQFFGDKEGEGWEIICDDDDPLNPCPPTDTAILFRMPPLAPTMQKSPSATETSLRETANVVSQRCDIVVFHPLLPVLETGASWELWYIIPSQERRCKAMKTLRLHARGPSLFVDTGGRAGATIDPRQTRPSGFSGPG